MHDRLTAPRTVTGNSGLVATGGRALLTALLAVWGTAPGGAAEPTEVEIAAYEQSFEGYCESVEDILDCRPHQTAGNNPETESLLLNWGREQGLQGLEGDIPLSRCRQALDLVYREIMRQHLPDVTVADQAPDVGVQVTVGEPRVVMWAPEGKTADRMGNIAKLGHLGHSLSVEGRWGQHMFPEINRLRGGLILVRVSVGGDGDRNYLDYVSQDGGTNWTHFARYFEGVEMPSRDWGVMHLPDGEEIKVVLPVKDPQNIFGDVRIEVADTNLKTYAGYYRLGDLPRELQAIPLHTRQPDQDSWTEEKAYLDPDILVKSSIPNPIDPSWMADNKILADGSIVRADFKQGSLLVMSDVGPDGTIKPQPHRMLRSYDRGRTWKVENIPGHNFLPFRYPALNAVTVRAHILAFPNGNLVASFRHGGLYWSGGGPLTIRQSSDLGKTWSEPKAIRVPGVNPIGLVLPNGIAVLSYQRPGVFFTFCADGKGDLWGNDVTLVKAWRHCRNENSCCNGTFLVTGPDRFIYVYTKWDVPDPWGQPRHAVLAQEFIVSRK